MPVRLPMHHDGASTTMNSIDSYLASFERVNGSVPAWLTTLRRNAMHRFADQGFPGTRLEDWKYTDVAPIAKLPFRLAAALPVRVAREVIEAASFGVGTRLVFVNGCYLPELSSTDALPAGVRVTSLGRVLAHEPDLIEAHLARYANTAHGFTTLNTAFIQDGAVVYLPQRAMVPELIHLLFISQPPGEPLVYHPRILIVAGDGSQATVVETYVGSGTGAYFTNAVTEIVVGANADITHYNLQRENEHAFHVATIEARQGVGSRLQSYAVSLGGALVRSDINTLLDAEGCECSLDGLYMVAGTQHVDHHTSIDHRQPRCTSRELYKGVLDGKSSGVFNGKVYVRPHAQQSDAGQVNKNLLLSDDATIDSKPQLEIFADDVKCSHGAAIGRLDDEALFYLRSRGIDAAAARDLLIAAFANELVERMQAAPVRAQLERLVWSRLHGAAPGGASR
ncbi:MAG: Fe-S cluster assembly protein SufD [Candidatus Binatia bacterium]|jgi:Fe-S cluster assembly protein SufD